jgi:anti-sigma-K factor RskA
MPEPDTSPQTEHADAAGWALGILDPGDSARFEVHLESCEECQQTVAEFGSAALLLTAPVPAMASVVGAEPPPGLQARTLGRVEQAAGRDARKAPWRRWSARLSTRLSAAAAVIVAAAVAITLTLGQAAPALAFTIPLHAENGATATGQAVAHHTSDGWSIQLTVRNLKPLPSGKFYECWYASPANRPGHPDLITAGTFVVGASGTATVQMWSAANPATFPIMEITAEQPGNATQHGQVLLSGHARK